MLYFESGHLQEALREFNIAVQLGPRTNEGVLAQRMVGIIQAQQAGQGHTKQPQ
jgi:hypothetical protein